MGRVQLFEISLSHGRVVYSPGEPLAGTVRVRLGAPLPFRAIRVTCIGSCGVSNKANDTAWVVEEGYFNSSLSLADKGHLRGGLPPTSLLSLQGACPLESTASPSSSCFLPLHPRPLRVLSGRSCTR